jgi:hypothetical protein
MNKNDQTVVHIRPSPFKVFEVFCTHSSDMAVRGQTLALAESKVSTPSKVSLARSLKRSTASKARLRFSIGVIHVNRRLDVR